MTCSEVVFQDETLLVKWLPGENRHLVLAFTGLKHGLGGLPQDEFIGSARGNTRNHVLFISDLKRSWYSSRQLVNKILETVNTFISKHKISKITAIGNSMGGYGALLFATHVPLQKVIAFAPQISMHPEVLLETRWIECRAHFGEDLPASVCPSIEGTATRFFVFFGAESQADAAQTALLPRVANLSLLTVQKCGHDVAAFLKKEGLLKPVLANVFKADGAGLDHILSEQMAYGT